MKKFVKLFCITCMLLVGLLIPITHAVYAGPAPALTKIKILEVWSDQSPTHRIIPTSHRMSDSYIFNGSKLFLKVQFYGYPNWGTLFYRDSTTTGQLYKCTEESRQLTNGGWIQVVSIPFKSFSGSYPDICVMADTANYNKHGAQTQSDYVRNVHIQK